MKFIRKCLDNKGSATIEASLVLIIFIMGYLILHSLSINLLVESITRKALFETGMDLSNYIQFVDTLEEVHNIKTSEIDLKDYEELIIKSITSNNSFIKDLFTLVKKDLRSEVQKKSYKFIIKKIFSEKISSIKSDVNYNNLGVENGIDGINISDIKILENSNSLQLEINYDFKIDKLGLFSYRNNVNQSVNIGSWAREDKNTPDKFSSIWDKSNFFRGKYFANEFREKYPGIVIKKGSGVDLYDVNNNTIIQIYSLNIFDKTYSEKTEDGYILKEDFNKTIKSYYKKLLFNINNMNNTFVSEDGRNFEINKPIEKLVIILPEEAKVLFNLNNIEKEVRNIEFLYLEKAINDN